MNNRAIDIVLKKTTIDNYEMERDIRFLMSHFLWVVPCASDATEIADTYNPCHLTGIVLCKYIFLQLSSHTQEDPGPFSGCTTLRMLFPGVQQAHVSDENIDEMDITTLVRAVGGVQQYWKSVCTVDGRFNPNVFSCLVQFLRRMGYLLLFSKTFADPTKEPNFEQIAHGGKFYRVKKKITRSIMCTFMVMLRSIYIQTAADRLHRSNLDTDQQAEYLRVQAYSESEQMKYRICDRIHQRVSKIKSVRGSLSASSSSSTMSGDTLWRYISNKMGEDSIGNPPRKISVEMETLLKNCCIFLDASSSFFDRNIVLDECVEVLQTALRFFYVVPSVETFKHLCLVESIYPGQRILYAFDYAPFDTGQMSQVVYLHTPMHKPRPPPSTVDDWKVDTPCGPLAAFMQLCPLLTICIEDCEDPLGLLGQQQQISRPSQYQVSQPDGCAETDKIDKRHVFIQNHMGLCLVDKENEKIFLECAQSPDLLYHPTLYLLTKYCHIAGLTKKVCTVAINSLKLSSTNVTVDL